MVEKSVLSKSSELSTVRIWTEPRRRNLDAGTSIRHRAIIIVESAAAMAVEEPAAETAQEEMDWVPAGDSGPDPDWDAADQDRGNPRVDQSRCHHPSSWHGAA